MHDGAPVSGRAALIDAAERLIAEQGPAVSLRQVVVAAGQRNSAAIRYHFGNREQLIAAVVEARQSVFEPKRLERLAVLEAGGQVSVRALLGALLTPVFEHQRASTGGYHARFMEKIRDYPGIDLLSRRDWAATTLIIGRLGAGMPESDPDRSLRTRGLITVVFALLADLERQDYRCADLRSVAEQTTLDMISAVVSTFATPAPPRLAAPDPTPTHDTRNG